LFYADTSLVIWVSSSFYALWYCIQASIPSTYKSPPYAFNELEVGLAYLPGSIGVILSMYVTGKAMDHNYRRTAAKHGFSVDIIRGDDLTDFPIEHGRSRGCGHLLVLSLAVMVGYGWAIARHAHVAVPLVLQFVQGFVVTWLTQCFSALLVDVFPETPSTAATAGNVTKCVLAAVAVAILQPLVDIMGKGWFFTLAGILCGGVGLISVMALRYWGMGWRIARRKKEKEKKQHQERRDDSHVELDGDVDGKTDTSPKTRGET
jgi:MFS family permease